MKQYEVTGMSCAACSARVEKAVSKVPGVTSCSVSLLTNSMGVEGTATDQEIVNAVVAAGYGAAPKGAKKEQTAAEEEEALKDTAIDIVIGNNKKHELVERIEAFMKDHKDRDDVLDINHEKQEYEEFFLSRTAEHTRAFIKVQDGCNQFCSYCIIPYARGRVRSRKPEHVVKEVERLAANGYKEIVLTGIHLSSYGTDLGDNLLHLIREVHKIDGIERIRLGSLEPRLVTEDFAKELSGLSKICPHFHLSLQSGCDATLQRMNRKYTAEEYAHACSLLRNAFDHPAITTDVIVGFPGETEEEFQITKEYLARIHFYEMHIFKYSKRQGTKAAVMPEQISEQKKTNRSAQLIKLGEKMSKEFRQHYIGSTQEVLFEEENEIDGRTYFTGYTREYVKVAVESEENLSNCLKSGRITGMLNDEVLLMD